jgi:hypothetical protein
VLFDVLLVEIETGQPVSSGPATADVLLAVDLIVDGTNTYISTANVIQAVDLHARTVLNG